MILVFKNLIKLLPYDLERLKTIILIENRFREVLKFKAVLAAEVGGCEMVYIFCKKYIVFYPLGW